ncbi:unnamed protein product [Kuraishia capsulata CBS 1993]|uniref:Uncharacterized protein n=1 Tax=Kuraishia capsulata CBS 1993 TaxID=1382522 RepID=W6MTT4_9ASCO|nr:uncharacterized protein KUCA_T00001197001 [Kuraishia capsulata CBS 1993]CDK25230.1 unnamed protein product [Kuraishia capsulata CBS 1993]
MKLWATEIQDNKQLIQTNRMPPTLTVWDALEAEGSSHTPPVAPSASKETCLSPKGVRSFLNLSRLATDDVIRQRLNGLLQNTHNLSGHGKEANKNALCKSFINDLLLPSWKARLQAIEYCSSVEREMRLEIEASHREVSNKKLVEPKLDPYAARDALEEVNQQFEGVDRFRGWLENESQVETIVRNRTIGIMQDSCGVRADDFGQFGTEN